MRGEATRPGRMERCLNSDGFLIRGIIATLAVTILVFTDILASTTVLAQEERIVEGQQIHETRWEGIGDGLFGAVGSIDVRYSRNTVPRTDGSTDWAATAWRGERISVQFVLWTKTGTEQVRLSVTRPVSRSGEEIPPSSIRPCFVSYVLGDGDLHGDVLDPVERLDIPPQSVQPIWLSIDVPAGIRPGTYEGRLTVRAAGTTPLTFNISIEVLPNTLPPPRQWSFHLDLWQNPWAVARYHRVRPWSEEHWSLLRPHLEMLAQIGQKCLTTTIVNRPWNGQTFDPYSTMVRWRREDDGGWSFDYSLFDEYVRFGAECGLDGAINCYSMVPWSYRFYYHDARTGDLEWIEARPGSEQYSDMWTAFLSSFSTHLRQIGWFERIVIAMDERSVEDMLQVVSLVREVDPELKLALAGGDHQELYDAVHDYCFYIGNRIEPELMASRRRLGHISTFYVCCNPPRPNTFTFSPPPESAWLGWFAAANHYDGMLRWAAISWTRDPLEDTSFGNWPAGDCFLHYPGPRSSIRFERLREGIQDYEKILILRTFLEARGSSGIRGIDLLDEALSPFRYPDPCDDEALAGNLASAKRILEELSLQISKQAR